MSSLFAEQGQARHTCAGSGFSLAELALAAPLYTSAELRGIAARRPELGLAIDKNIFQSEVAARMAYAA